jgi:hypothetical protein
MAAGGSSLSAHAADRRAATGTSAQLLRTGAKVASVPCMYGFSVIRGNEDYEEVGVVE